jgi:hypothetical protein
MDHRVLYTCICLLGVLAFIALPVVTSQTILESPPILKKYVAEIPSDDEHFFVQVTEFMTQLSDQTLNVRSDLRFFALLASGYNIENRTAAQKLIDFLFYSAKAGEHYQQYIANKDRYFTPISAENENLLAKEYRTLAEKTFNSCDICQEYYPDFVMYTLPSAEDGASGELYQFTGRLGF